MDSFIFPFIIYFDAKNPYLFAEKLKLIYAKNQ